MIERLSTRSGIDLELFSTLLQSTRAFSGKFVRELAIDVRGVPAEGDVKYTTKYECTTTLT